MATSKKQRLIDYYREQGPRRLIRRLFKFFFKIYLFTSLFLVLGTPFLFNTFEYSKNLNQKKFAALVTDSSAIKKQLKPKTEKKYLGQMKPTEYSICYVHGFSASRMELEPVISNVAKNLKANLFFTRLKAHGYKDPQVLKTVKAQDWINDTQECFEVAKRTGKKMILIGTSTGGSLVSLLAAQNLYQPYALILVSPNFGLKDKKSFLLAGYLGDHIAKFVFDNQRSFKALNKMHESYWTTSYPAEVLKQLMIVTMAAKNLDFSKIKTPTFIAYAEKDEILEISEIKKAYEKIKVHKKLVTDQIFESHVFAGDALSPIGTELLTEDILNFIRSIN